MKRFVRISGLCLLILLSGCSSNEKMITQKEWLKMIADQFYDLDEAEDWQKGLQEYAVIENSDEISDQALSQSYAADILRKAASLDWEETEESKAEDSSQICLNLGIFDEIRNDAQITEKEAEQWIQRAYQCWMNPVLKNSNQSLFKEEFTVMKAQDLNLEEAEEKVIFMRTEMNPMGSFYRVTTNELEEIELSDIVESIDFTFQDELGFSDAVIVDMTASEFEEFNPAATTTLTSKTFEWEGFKITWRLLNNGIKAVIEKKEKDVTITDQISIGNIVPSIRWKSTLTHIEHAFFKLNYTASHSLNVEKKLMSGNYFDAKEIVHKNWQVDLNELAKKTSSVFEQEIPIARIFVPLPNAPYLNIELCLSAKLSADGEISLAVSSSGLIGFEIKNNKLRILNEVVKNASCDINAKLSALLQLTSALNLAAQPLADLSFDVGIGATMSMIGHLKNAEGQLSDALIGVGSLNILSDLIHSDSDQEILICGDLSAHWIAKLNLNSSKTLAYRLGLTLNHSILNEKNAPLFDKAKLHIENFKIVDQCSWNPAKKKNTSYLDISSYQYSIEVEGTSKVEVTNLPPEISRSDLIYSSLDESVARIDEKGILYGVGEGSTRIFVKTKDENWQISAAVLVVKS